MLQGDLDGSTLTAAGCHHRQSRVGSTLNALFTCLSLAAGSKYRYFLGQICLHRELKAPLTFVPQTNGSILGCSFCCFILSSVQWSLPCPGLRRALSAFPKEKSQGVSRPLTKSEMQTKNLMLNHKSLKQTENMSLLLRVPCSQLKWGWCPQYSC